MDHHRASARRPRHVFSRKHLAKAAFFPRQSHVMRPDLTSLCTNLRPTAMQYLLRQDEYDALVGARTVPSEFGILNSQASNNEDPEFVTRSSFLGFNRGATYSRCARYRYSMWILYESTKPICNMIICNPSIARFEENDPAVTGYVSRARALGFGGVVLTSLFALRGDDDAASISDDYRIGAFNDHALLEAAKGSTKVICAWGNRGASSHRSNAVIKLLSKNNIALHAIALNLNGSPVDGTTAYAGIGRTRELLPFGLSPPPTAKS